MNYKKQIKILKLENEDQQEQLNFLYSTVTDLRVKINDLAEGLMLLGDIVKIQDKEVDKLAMWVQSKEGGYR